VARTKRKLTVYHHPEVARDPTPPVLTPRQFAEQLT
jgi:hypothetical protein